MKERLKVAVIAKGISPYIIGGAERVTEKVVKGLREKGHEVKVITKYRKEENMPELGIEIDEDWSEKAAIDAMNFHPDIIYICRYWGESASIYIDGFPVVSMQHDPDLETLPLPRERYSKLSEITKRCLGRSDKIVTPSNYVKEYLIRNCSTKSDKIVVIPLGLGGKNVQEVEKKEKNEGEECFKILYVGRIAPNKGIHILLKAFESVCKIFPVELIIIGGFTEDYSHYYNHAFEKASSLPIKFLGRVREDEKIRLYQESDLVVCPSISHEGFGIVPSEALRYNGVVVASDIFVETGVLNEDVSFVYQRDDAGALSSAISEALMLDWDKKKELKERANSFLENFSWERHITELESVMFEMRGGK
jgi:glycosyltransferase involved in cell wall biosynthesis